MPREYAGGAKRTQLVGDITAASTTFTVADATSWPTGAVGPFAIALNLGRAGEEKVLVQSRSGNTLTVATGGRGYDGTTAATHQSGADVDHVLTAIDIREATSVTTAEGTAYNSARLGGISAPLYLLTSDANAAYPSLAGGSTIIASGAAVIPLVVKLADGQTAHGLAVRDSANVELAAIDKGGRIYSGPGASGFGVAAQMASVSAAPTTRALTLRSAVAQSVHVLDVQNSNGTTTTAIEPGGVVLLFDGATTVRLSPGIGGAIAAGASTGSINITVDGVARRIPYF